MFLTYHDKKEALYDNFDADSFCCLPGGTDRS